MVVRVAAAAPGGGGNRGGATDRAPGGGPKPQGRHSCCRGGGAGVLAKSSLLSLLLLLLGPAEAIHGPDLPAGLKVLHASIVMRHGERTRLEKTVSEAEFGDNDGVVLTKEGELDCYDLGAQLRERYMPRNLTHEEASTTTIDGLTLWYDAQRVQIESSGYDRTLESATALALGLYPMGQTDEDVRANTELYNHQIVVPVHSSLPENDPVILGHDKCPVFNDNWEETYLSEEFLELQDQATKDQGSKPGFVTQVMENFQTWNGGGAQNGICYAEAVNFEANQLQRHAPYNLWDCAKTANAAGDSTAVDIIMEAQLPEEGLLHFGLDEDKVYLDKGWMYLEYLVYEIEDGKYKQNVVGRMAGGLYLTRLKQRMMEVREHYINGEAETTGRLPGLHITSGHYGTLKGIASALDLGGLEGIPPYASHLTFELLYDENAAALGEEDSFSVRILYQSSPQYPENLDFKLMGVVFDGSFSASISDEELASQRNPDTGIMPWNQWNYLLNIQNMGSPAIYTDADPEQEWCYECLATTPNACLRLEVEILEQHLEEAEIATSQAVSDKEAVDDGVGGTHVALMSIFGLILGIGIGICIKPCVDKINSKSKSANSGAVSGERGLESWASSAGNSVNGSFRLGAKNPSTRHVMGAVDASQMVPVRTAEYGDESARMNGNGNGSHYDEEDAGAGSSSIPSFAPTSALGEPVPFPHRRQPSGMVSGVDSSMMSGIDAEDDGDDDMMAGGGTSRAESDGTGSNTTSDTAKIEAEAGEADSPPAEEAKEEGVVIVSGAAAV